MVNKCLIHAILIVYENTHEIYKQSVQASLGGWDVAKKYQVHLQQQTEKNLTDINAGQNIHLI